MTEKPIIFSGPMVRAILDGRKTQTRRVIKKASAEPDGRIRFGNPCSGEIYIDDDSFKERAPTSVYANFHAGDRLWVRETCSAVESHDGLDCVRYDADQVWMPIEGTPDAASQWVELYHYRSKRGATVPSIHMPRWASRITLEITNIHAERLQDISEEDAVAEGVDVPLGPPEWPTLLAIDAFRNLWDSIYARKHPWGANPWVWVIEFRRVEK